MGGSETNGTQACAACKYQRRKCYPDCVLARYFPPGRTQQFLDVHNLFGVSNLMKFYNSVSPEYRDATVETMMLEAQLRREDPVFGSFGVIRDLTAQLEATHRELEALRQQTAFYAPPPPPPPPPAAAAPFTVDLQGDSGIRERTMMNEDVKPLDLSLAMDEGSNSNSVEPMKRWY